MFDKYEYRTFAGTSAVQFAPPVSEFWAKEGFRAVWVSPFCLQGESFDSRIGLRRRFSLTLNEQGGTTHMDLRIEAKVTDVGLVGGAAAAFICFPIAVIAGAVSYSEYEKNSAELNRRFWGYMGTVSTSLRGNN